MDYVSLNNLPPVKFWGLDPLHRCSIKLFIKQINNLPQVQGFQGVFVLHGHPITRFEVLGCIVSKHLTNHYIKYAVDDGTGVISCCLWLNENLPSVLCSYNLGDLVSVTGKLQIFRDEREIRVERLTLEEDLNIEYFHWSQIINFQEIYKAKFVIPTDKLNEQ
ncbi:CST complex subunit STN1 isoform X3 [Hydra vulgaris]|uniref:CST complex subunit STN1 n=1 Tax=Hydra vulgaris TaxID=6087 RepID=A0ABM4CFW8_HYDVU